MSEELIQQDSPKYLLKAFAFDYFLLENFKKLSIEYKLGQNPVEVSFNIKTELRFYDELEIIQSIVNITTSLLKDKIPVCKISEAEMSFDFPIENYVSFKGTNKQYIYQEPFLKHLNNIAISTSRGLLFDKFSGTPLQGVVMPLIFADPNAPILTKPATDNK